MEIVRLAEVSELNPKFTGNLSSNDTVGFVPMAAVSESTRRIEHEEERAYGNVAKGFTHFRNGDVIVAKITPCFENGKMALVQLKHEFGFGSTEFHVIRPNHSRIDARFLFHFLAQERLRREGQSRMTGSAGQRRVPKSFYEQLEIPLPSLPEQQRIAAILDAADALRARRRAALGKLDALLQSVFLEMFGDPVGNEKGWEQKALGDIGKVVTGNTPSRMIPEYFGSYIEWIKSDNINSPYPYLTQGAEGLSELGAKVGRIAPAGSILVTCIAGSPDSIGNAAIADRSVAFNQQINALVPDAHHTTMFLYTQFLIAKKLVQRASTNSMKGMVNKSAFSSIQFISPPFNLQGAFSSIAAKLQEMRTAQSLQVMELDDLFKSIQQRAFYGEL